jgi:hypothetical protein
MCDNVVARIFKCDKCGFEVRSDWKFCPNCAAGINCTCDQPASVAKARVKQTMGGPCGCGCDGEPPRAAKKGTQTRKPK